MPLLDSFKVDHTRMNAPAVRIAKTMRTPKGDNITVFDRCSYRVPPCDQHHQAVRQAATAGADGL